MLRHCLLLLTSILLIGCDGTQSSTASNSQEKISSNHSQIERTDSITEEKPVELSPEPTVTIEELRKQGATWVDISEIAPDIQLDIRYATTNNFIGEQIYECPKCLLRLEVAAALLKVKKSLHSEGYGIKLFDCFRPLAAQERLWAIKPDRRYVTPPEKGSMHNRGAAVDITLTDLDGNELDMGTDFDVFKRAAWHSYRDLPKQVIKRRITLKSHMINNDFKSITTEWWHYSYLGKGNAIRKSFWNCD